jgi:chromosome partitioning protein
LGGGDKRKMGRAISLSNQKGGVGKTTTAINLASYLAEFGKKVLLVDIDPQGNAGSGLGIDKDALKKTIYNVLIEGIPIEEVIQHTAIENLDLVPANIHLSGAQIELLDEENREYKLKEAIKPVKDKYDFILFDNPPSLGILTLNSLTASDAALIPLQCEYYALEGLGQLLKIVQMVQKKLNNALVIDGVILTMYDSRTNLSNQVVKDIREYFKEKVFKSIVPRNVRLSEAPSFGKPINLYDRICSGALSYENLAKEVIDRASHF